MNQAFLGAEINKGYIDISISDKKRLIKKLVYFDVNESFNELVKELHVLFNSGIQVLHCGFVSTVLTDDHWIYKISSLDLNIQIHNISPVDVLNEFKKLTNKSITTVLICNYLKSNTFINNTEQFYIPEFENQRAETEKEQFSPIEFLNTPIDIDSTSKKYSLKNKSKIEKTEVAEIETVDLEDEIASIDFIEKQAAGKIINNDTVTKESDIGKTLLFNLIIKESEKNLQTYFLDILEKSFPEAIVYCEEKIPIWLVNLMYKYPNRKKLSKARLATVSKLVGKDHAKAISLIATIRLNIEFEKNENLEYLLKRVCENLLNLNNELNKVKRFVKRSFNHPHLEKLSIISNIDKFLTLFLIEELGDIDRFEKVDDMTTYFGVHFNEVDFKLENTTQYSGYKAMINRISEKVIKSNSYFKQLYDQKIALKHGHNEVIDFIDFKLSRVIFGLLKTEKTKVLDQEKELKQETFLANTVIENKLATSIALKRKEKIRKMLKVNKEQVADIARVAL